MAVAAFSKKTISERGAILASNPIGVISTTDKLKQALQTVTGAALFIEQILEATGVGGFDAAGAEQLTTAFSNLAAIAIQAAQDASGREITPDSILALMPAGTALAAPPGA
jgi:hypothetical protein